MRRCAKCGRRVSKDILVCDPCWGMKKHILPRKGSKADKAAWKISIFLLLPILIGCLIWRSCEQERKDNFKHTDVSTSSTNSINVR